MHGAAIAPARENLAIRYNDYSAQHWLRNAAPCRWGGKTGLEFRYVPFRTLQPAASGKHPKIVSAYVWKLRNGKPISPLVVSASETGIYYIHDGNHRWEAIRQLVQAQPDVCIRVAVVVPKSGFRFRWRWFGAFGTYVLEPEHLCHYRPVDRRARPHARVAPLLGRTLVLVAHPDDESGGCAALLQRMRDPIVVFATDGAPADEFFWRPFGSRQAYSRLRRQEALRGLAAIGVRSVHFLDEYNGREFLDQQLHRNLSAAVAAVDALVRQYLPDAILVPAYEGGHPDHDACSFVGSVVGELHSIPVWEMPLYHRSRNGRIICQRFCQLDGTEVRIRYTSTELLNRNALITNYASQMDLGEFVKSRIEYFRPQPKYDYTKAPNDGVVNYEAWGWPVSSAEVSRSFERLLNIFNSRSDAGQSYPKNGPPLSRDAGFEQSQST